MQIVAACAVWLNYAGEILKKDKGFYKQKNKMLLNALLDSNLEVIKKSEKTEALVLNNPKIKRNLEFHYKQLTGETLVYDTDSAVEDLNMMQEMFGLFLEIYLTTSTVDLVKFFIQLRSIKNKEKLYTEEELLWYTEQISKKVCNNTVDVEFIKTTFKEINNLEYQNTI